MRRRRLTPATISYAIAINTCAETRQWQSAVALLSEMQSLDVEANLITWTTVGKALEALGRWALAVKLIDSVEQHGLQIEVVLASTTMKTLANERMWRGSLRLLHDIQERWVQVNVVTYGASLISCCGTTIKTSMDKPGRTTMPRLLPVDEQDGHELLEQNAVLWSYVLNSLSDMSNAAVPPSQIVNSIAITACEKGMRWDCALNILDREELITSDSRTSSDHMVPPAFHHTGHEDDRVDGQNDERKNVAIQGPDVPTYNAAVSACQRCHQWLEAFHVLARMRKRTLQLSVVSHNAALNVFVHPATSSDFSWELAIDAIDNLQRRALAADSATYVEASSICEQASRWKVVLELVRQRQHDSGADRPELDVPALNGAISACSVSSRWQHGVMIFSRMLTGTWLAADAVGCDAAISGCESRQHWHLALQVAEEAAWAGVQPDLVVLNSVVRSVGKGSQWQLAVAHVAVSERRRLVGDIMTFNAVISACEQASRWEMVLAILADVKKTLTPDRITFNSAISACENMARWREALALLSELKTLAAEQETQNLAPDDISYNAVVSACSKAGQQQIVLDLLIEMQREDVLPDKVTFTAALSAFKKHWRQSLELVDAMERHHLQPNAITYDLALDACELGLRGERARELLDETDSAALQLVEWLSAP